MKSFLKKIIKEEFQSIILEKAKMSGTFRKAMEALYDIEYKQQELRKKFVAEKNPAKKVAMKKDLIALHKKVQSANLDFNKALANEPVEELEEGTTMKKNKTTNLYEHYLGELPSSKLMKMKWNPLKEEAPKPEGESEDVYDEYTKGLGPEGDEDLDEAAPKMAVDPNAEYVSSVISRLGVIGRRATGSNVKKDIKKALKVLQNLRSSIQVGR